MKISIHTSMTDPEERMDPWKESLSCYKDFADEVVITGEDWPEEKHQFSLLRIVRNVCSALLLALILLCLILHKISAPFLKLL